MDNAFNSFAAIVVCFVVEFATKQLSLQLDWAKTKISLMFCWIVFSVCLAYLIINCYLLTWHPNKALTHFADDEEHFNSTLFKILRPRHAGSLGHAQVRDYLIKELHELGFVTNRDEFYDMVTLSNVIGIINLEAPNFLALSCHYDTKKLKNADKFVGATNAAVPCAILLNVAKTLGPYLRGPFAQRDDIGLLLMFFDGHETAEDDVEELYGLNGSRHFVEVETIPLESIEVVITLNYIGAPNQIYKSHYGSTNDLHSKMADIELDLRNAGALSKNHILFHKLVNHDTDIEDDHNPFLDEGVPVMHISPEKYPKVRHTEADNVENLHWPTVRNMNAIIRTFVYEYLENHDDYINYRND